MRASIGTPFPPSRALAPSRATLVVPPALRRLREVAIIGAAVLLYFLVRGLVDGREVEAVANARWLVALERALGLFWEPQLQGWALGIGPLDTLANWVYIWGHWPVIVATLTWLFVRHRAEYGLYRNALLLSGAIGLIVFTLFPMAPPRLVADLGFVDTITLQSNSYRLLQPPSLVNQYAAMPSLHVGWDLLMGIAIARHAPRRLRPIGIVLPAAMAAAVVLTANHYLLDGLVGAMIVLAALRLVAIVRAHAADPRPWTRSTAAPALRHA